MWKLSVVIITKNEERNIGRCLQSVQRVADDVVVLDAMSEDHTEQICRQYGAHFVQREWAGYVDSKNFANLLAENDMIMSLDADEVLSEELVHSVLALKASDRMPGCVYSMNRKMNYCGQWIMHGGWYPDTKVRIFDRRHVKWVGRKVHEVLSIPSDFQVVRLNGDLLHYSFYTVEEHRRQNAFFAQLFAEDAIQQGIKTLPLTPYWHAGWRFLRDYFFKLGFMDGSYGWKINLINAQGVFLKYRLIRKSK